jgi:hypothetical protein
VSASGAVGHHASADLMASMISSRCDPGRVADIICTHVVASLKDKQGLLARLDPVARLEKVDAMLAASL